MTAGARDTVLVGAGHAARSFHLPAVPDLVARGLATGDIRVVDPAVDPADPALPRGVQVFRRLADAAGDPDAVVHVCTGPADHAAVVAAAVRLGYRRFVVEKPMTATLPEARELSRLCARGDADVVVVANWTASALTDELRGALLSRSAIPVREIVLRQHKPRLERTLANGTHTSAFEVEMPHLVALAMSLVPEPLEVVDAACTDMVIGDERRAGMGSASVLLRSASGVPIRLSSELTAPWRERSARIEWTDGARVVGFHPCDSADRYSQLFTWDADGRCAGRRLLYDDTVRRLLRAAYAWFTGRGPRPASDVVFGAAVAEVLDTARRVAVAGEHRPEQLIEVGYGTGILR